MGKLVIGVPEDSNTDVVLQAEEKSLDQVKLFCRTTKTTRLSNSLECLDLLAMLVYDIKHIHLISTCSESVYWVVK